MRGAVVGLAMLVPAGAFGQALTPVASAEDLRAVCAEPDPARIFTTTFPAAGWSFECYDARRARLAVATGKGFHGEGYELVFHHIAGLGSPREPGFEIAVPLDRTEAAGLETARRRGELALKLIFQLAAPADGSAVCATTVSGDGEGIRAAVEPLAFEIARDGAPLASGEAARYTAAREAAAPRVVTAPRVLVSTPMLTSAGGRAGGNVAKAASALAPRLLDCYRLGLHDEPALRGPFVAGIEVGADGRVTNARAELDGLGVPAVTTCVLRLVKTARFPGGAERLSIPMRFSD